MRNALVIMTVLWLVTLAGMGYVFFHGMTHTSPDLRLAIELTAAEKEMVLSEMRTILSAVNGVVNFSSQGKYSEAADSARKAGMVMAVDIQPAFIAKLPLEFKKLGMSLHGDFDALAADLEKGLTGKSLTEKELLVRLGAMTQKCVACHSAYRFSQNGLNQNDLNGKAQSLIAHISK